MTHSYITWLRARVGSRKILLVTATAFIRDERGRVLFQHRADFQDAWWGLPGGVLEPGETIGACIRREVREETGLRIEPVHLTGIYTGPRYEVVYPNGDLVQQVTACFDCRIAGGPLRADGDEINALVFYPPDRLPHTPLWYADMAHHALQTPEVSSNRRSPTSGVFFDPPISPAPPPAHPGDYIAELRKTVGRAPLVNPGCAALIRDEAGRILLVFHRDFQRWGLPAGSMELGESAADTVVRETLEETGLEVEPLRLLDLSSGDLVSYPNGDQLYVFRMLFECQTTGGALRPDGDETLDARFFPLDALPPLNPWHEAVLKRVLADPGPATTFD